MMLRLAPKFQLPILLALVAVADWWFYQEFPLGWVLGAFALLLWLACWPRQWDFAPRRVIAVELSALGLTVLSLVYAPGALNIMLVFILLYIYRITMEAGWSASLPLWWLRLMFKMITSPFEWVGMLFGRRDPAERLVSERGVRRVFLWILPILATGVFAWLFALANPIFDSFCQRVLRALTQWIQWPAPEHFAFWILMILIVSSVVSLRLFNFGCRMCRWVPGESFATAGREAGELWQKVQGANAVTAMLGRALVLFNLLFLIQNIFDIEYLWAGLALPTGVTYAEYAHRGAYPLIAVALLSGAIVMATFRSGTQASRWLHWMVYVWLLQNIFLIASSIFRLEKYVSVYSLSLLRVAAFLWMLLVAAGMLLLMYRIYSNRSNGWLVRANLLTALALLLGCGFLNIAGFVADYNVAHCREATGDSSHAALDVDYLLSLDYPALPALVGARDAGWCDVSLNAPIQSLHEDVGNWRRWTLRKAITAARVPKLK